jgi:hypothetical protein
MNTQGSLNLLFRAGMRKNFRDEWDRYEPEYPEFLKVDTTDEPEIRATIITSISRLLERGDGEAVIYDDIIQGPQVVGVDKEFAGGIIVTRRTREDDKYGKSNQAAKHLAHAGRMTYEYRAASLLDDAFTGTFFRTIDNLPLISTSHTNLNSPALNPNRPASDVALSVTGVTSLLDLAQRVTDHNGDPIRMAPDKLIISNNAADVNTALAIWNSAKEPFTPNNTDNVTRRRMPNPDIVISHYKLLTTRSYFMQDSRYQDAFLSVKRAMEFDDTFDFDTQAAKFQATTRFIIMVVDYRGWWGANPT